MKYPIIKTLLSLLMIVVFSCVHKKERTKPGSYKATEVIEDNITPTVDIKKYTLIQPENENREKDAKQILALKRSWPLIMQSPNRIGFDTILSQNFTFWGDGKLLNREDYISDRTKPSEWVITHVKYDNVVLQFFGQTAVLTYRNEVTNKNTNTKEIEIEYINWADIYVLENSKWEIGSAHVIDIRIEKK